MNKNITEANLISKLDAKDSILCEAAGSLKRVTVEDLSTSLGEIHTSQALKTYWNTGQPSTVLQQSGNRDVLIDYLQACKRYVFNASGTKKAEIAFVEQFEDLGTSIVHFVDGYSTTVNALNEAGCNWMTLRPELGFLSTEEDGVPVFYCAGRGSIAGGHSFPNKYVGMFKAYLQGEVLKSQPNRVATGNMTTQVFHQKAKNGGSNYGLYSYSDWCKDNMIHLAYFGNTNYEENVGVGLINNYDYVRNIVSGICLADMNNSIVSYGTSPCKDSQGNSVNRVHFFGMEGLGEQVYEKLGGIQFDETTAYVWGTNEWFEGATSPIMRVFPRTNTPYQLMKKARGGEFFDMLSVESNGSGYATYFCDGNGGSNGNILVVGGNVYGGSRCGVSCASSSDAFDDAFTSRGARLAFWGEPSSVAGSDIVN